MWPMLSVGMNLRAGQKGNASLIEELLASRRFNVKAAYPKAWFANPLLPTGFS